MKVRNLRQALENAISGMQLVQTDAVAHKDIEGYHRLQPVLEQAQKALRNAQESE